VVHSYAHLPTYLPTPRRYRLLAFATVSCILPPSPSHLVLMYRASHRKTLPPPQIPPESECYQEVQYATKNSMSVTAAQKLLICTSYSAISTARCSGGPPANFWGPTLHWYFQLAAHNQFSTLIPCVITWIFNFSSGLVDAWQATEGIMMPKAIHTSDGGEKEGAWGGASIHPEERQQPGIGFAVSGASTGGK